MRPVLAEAGCPTCNRQMAAMWPEAVAWECWQVTAHNQEWAAGFDVLADLLAGTTRLPQNVDPGPRWVCPDCEVVDWATENQPDCLQCGKAMWWAADYEDRNREP
jgi:hypothetical protein